MRVLDTYFLFLNVLPTLGFQVSFVARQVDQEEEEVDCSMVVDLGKYSIPDGTRYLFTLGLTGVVWNCVSLIVFFTVALKFSMLFRWLEIAGKPTIPADINVTGHSLEG